MLNIKEVEKLTNITKQNIRYYERQGLIFPKRNPENDYREYSEREIAIEWCKKNNIQYIE